MAPLSAPASWRGFAAARDTLGEASAAAEVGDAPQEVLRLNNEITSARSAGQLLDLSERRRLLLASCSAGDDPAAHATLVSAATILNRLARTRPGPDILQDARFSELLCEAREALAVAKPQAIASIAWSLATMKCTDATLLAAISAAARERISGFNTQALANTVWSCAKLLVVDQTLLAAISGEVRRKIAARALPQEIANTAWAIATLRYRDEQLIEAIAAAAITMGREPSLLCSQNLSNTAWAFATLQVLHTPLLAAISGAAIGMMPSFGSQELGNLAWAVATLTWEDAPLLSAISASAISRIDSFNPQELTNTSWAMATLGLRDVPLLYAIAAAAIARLRLFQPRWLASTAWSFATLQCDHQPLFDALAAEALRKLPDFRAQNLANTLWSFAKIQCADKTIIKALAAEAITKIDEFKPQELASTASSLALLQLKDSTLLEAISAAARAKMVEFGARSLANTLWAFASLEWGDAPLCDALAARSLGLLQQGGGAARHRARHTAAFLPQELASTAWACATLRFVHEPLLAAIASAAMGHIEACGAHELSNLSWSFATLVLHNEPLLESIAAAARARIGDFKPQEIANMAWSCAPLKFKHEPLLDAISAAAIQTCRNFEPRHLSATAWAFASLEVFDAPLLSAIAGASLPLISAGEFGGQALSNTAWAFATLACPDRPLFAAIAAESINRLTDGRPQELANTAWSFATLVIMDNTLRAAIAASSISLRYRPQELANTAWAYATLQFADDQLLQSLAAAAHRTLTAFGPAGLATTAWAFATLRWRDGPLLTAIAAQAIPHIRGFRQEELRMTLWALAQRRNLGEAWSLLEHAERSGRAMSALCFSALLAECEQRGLLREEIGLLRGLVDTVEGADAKALVAATAGAASMREEAGQPQPQQGSQGVAKYPRVAPAPAFGGGGEVDEPWITHMREAAAAHPPAPGTPYWKELRLLAHVLNTARRGDPGSVCAAIETFGEDVLNPSGLWLKVAGGGKADVLAAGVRRAPPKGSILEIGTYCGYSALRMATARPGTRIVTLEVDPAHMVIARNIVAYAGLGHMIDVWTGHSKDVLHRLPARYGGRIEFCAVFMDQKGSRYDEDLDTLEHHRLLKPGAVVMADNVLKPGSPLFLWRLTKSGAYKTDIVRVKEFAMPSEDWMSVSVRNEIQDGASDGTTDELEGVVREGVVRPPEPPEELVQMQWESDRIRSKATRAGHGVSFQEWAAYAEQVKQRLDKYGIEATIDSADL